MSLMLLFPINVMSRSHNLEFNALIHLLILLQCSNTRAMRRICHRRYSFKIASRINVWLLPKLLPLSSNFPQCVISVATLTHFVPFLVLATPSSFAALTCTIGCAESALRGHAASTACGAARQSDQVLNAADINSPHLGLKNATSRTPMLVT